VKVTVDPARCSGSGNCAYWAPGVFDLGDDGIAVVIGDPSAHTDRVVEAAQHCPTAAITLAE
jgi:ferredoxin